ncbi:MAG: hypothetical protein WA104_03510 [Thermodesulfovibrionales bacterium]
MSEIKRDVFWIDKLSFRTLSVVLRRKGARKIDIRFIRRDRSGLFFFLLLRFFGIINGSAAKIKYSMGDMRSPNGEALYYDCYRIASETSISAVKELSALPVYRLLSSMFPEDKVSLYFEKMVHGNIFPLIRMFCVARWHITNDNDGYFRHYIVWPSNGFFEELRHNWPGEEVSLEGYGSLSVFAGIRSLMKVVYNYGQDIFAAVRPKGLRPGSSQKPCIAVHYAEGIDLKCRSDLFWQPDSNIAPERILIYFDRSYNHAITKELARQIESNGMQWLNLCWRMDVPFSIKNVWRAPLRKGYLSNAFKNNAGQTNVISKTDRWLLKVGTALCKDVEYWRSFYRAFNIKIHIDAVEGGLQNIAQNIALDLAGGIRIGKQRSEWPCLVSDMSGCYPDHVFFSWNSQAPMFLEKNRNSNDYCIVSGFPYDYTFSEHMEKSRYIQKSLHDKGVKFAIALYDNMYGNDFHFSKDMMASFYEKFLKWLIKDREIGLIIKSKKPQILHGMAEINTLLNTAKSTGRCIVMDNVYGRLPSEAAFAADMAVGIGVSSALSEAVIAGRRGVNCDLTKVHSHPYYQWGYNKIIFDDIDKLMDVMRRFKEDPESEQGFGDFSAVIDRLDPFRDGQAGKRVGTYMRWFLEAIDAGNGRETALQLVNERYAAEWGRDKVIEMSPSSNSTVLQQTGSI